MGIFDRLAGKPASAGSLAQQLEIHPEGCRRLLVVLHRLGLLTRNGDEFSNTELAGFLTSDSPFRMNGLGIPSGVPASRSATPRASRSTTTAPIPFAPAASVFMRISAMRSCTAWKSFAREVCGHAVQLMGGYGYSREYGMERRLRDSWGWGIAGGAIDIQKTTSRAQ